jgi:hypothetical protein
MKSQLFCQSFGFGRDELNSSHAKVWLTILYLRMNLQRSKLFIYTKRPITVVLLALAHNAEQLDADGGMLKLRAIKPL